MSTEKPAIIIKKYANRRLYNTDTSSYITLQDLAVLVKNDDNIKVVDAKTGDDLTRSVLAQIIFDEENKGETLLPQNFLKELIKYYDDSLQALIPGYLEYALKTFGTEQDTFRTYVDTYMDKAMDASNSLNSMLEKQTRANMELFEKSFNLLGGFQPQHMMGADFLANTLGAQKVDKPAQKSAPPAPEPAENPTAVQNNTPAAADAEQVEALKEEIETLQRAINILAKKAQ